MDPITFLVFIIYLIGMLVIGIIMYKRTEDLSDYVLGGRQLGPGVTALSAGASDMSGWLLLGLPGAIYASGFGEAWMGIGLATGAYLNWQFIAKRLRVYTEVSQDSITIPDFLSNRFKDQSNILRVASALVILIFFTFYTSSGMVAGAKLFESSFGLSYSTALLIGTVIVVSYTLLGGFLAVSWTDFFQGCLMLLALLVIPIVALYELGGLNETIQTVGSINPDHFNMIKGVGAMAIVSSIAWGLGYFGQPHIIVRFMAIRSPKDIPKAQFIGMTWMILGLFGAVLIGFTGLAFIKHQGVSTLNDFGIEHVMANGNLLLEDSEKILIAFSQILFNPFISGVLLAAILAAIMSTIDSQLLVSSSAVAEDFYKAIFKKDATEKELVMIGRIATLTIAIIAAVIAINPESTVLELVSYAWAGFGASFGPVILLSLFWRDVTRDGALAGIIIGALTVIVWGGFLSGGIFDLYEIVPGFILNLITVIIVSLRGKPSQEMYDEYDQTLEKLNKY